MKDKKLAFIEAIIKNNTKLVKKFLAEGMSPNVYLDADKISPLHFAAQNNAVDVIPLLVDAGADLHAVAQTTGQTVLDVAILSKHPKIIQLLNFYLNRFSEIKH